MLSLANDGCLGHGLIHLFFECAATFGFVSDPAFPGWCHPGLLCCGNMAGPFAVVDAWCGEVSADL